MVDSKGMFVMCAADHRDSLKRDMNPENPENVSYKGLVHFKMDLCRAITPYASAVLLDPRYGAAQAIAENALDGNQGLLVSMEKTGYRGEKTARITEILPGWNVRKAKKMGVSAVKILLYYRPDLKDLASQQLDLLNKLAGECLQEDIPLLVEPVSYPVSEQEVTSGTFKAKKPELIVETAREITGLPIDVLKAEFPGDMNHDRDKGVLLENCRRLNDASRLPWVLLSAGVGYETFKAQVRIACRSGASGFLAGRALWQEGVKIKSREERMHFFENSAAKRLRELSELADKYGSPWFSKMGSTDGTFRIPEENWFQNYE
jgi:tagatose 1,6-diphosphate aldolase